MENRNDPSSSVPQNEADAARSLADTPTTLLPNPGEGGPIAPGITITGGESLNQPTIVVTGPGGNTPSSPGTTIPGGSGPISGGIQLLPGSTFPLVPSYAAVRFLNASHGYPAFRIYVDGTRVVSILNSATASNYVRVTSGRHRITVAGQDGYIYIEKTLPFSAGSTSTVAIINRTGGLDMTVIADNCPSTC